MATIVPQTVVQLPHQRLGHLDVDDLKLAIERNFHEIAHIMHALQIYEGRTGRPVNARVTNSGMTDEGVLPTTQLSDRLVGLNHALQIAAGAVADAQIAVGGITGTKIANGTVTAANIADLTITAQQLANFAVTSAKLAEGAVVDTHIMAGAITAQRLRLPTHILH